MATKTITIKEEVYNMLVSLKRENESFSDLLERLAQKITPKDLLSEMKGSLDLGDIDTLLEEIRTKREEWR